MAVHGPVWTERHYYWLDIAIGPGIALLLASVSVGRPAFLVRLLGTRPMRARGSFSYSLYLIHVPVVVVVAFFVARPHVAAGLPRFWVTLALAAPLAVLVAWGFGKVFEIPFQRYRSLVELRSALSRRPVTRG
jgi:peptidoglycan/LPS O-acetylase OafA/YrhL